MELLGLLVFPGFVAGWVFGRADWNGERRYWKDRARRRVPPAVVLQALPVGTEQAHVVIDAGQRPALGQEAA